MSSKFIKAHFIMSSFGGSWLNEDDVHLVMECVRYL
jgi:hypothetical protein